MVNCLRIMTLNLHTYQEMDANKFASLEEFFYAYKKIGDLIAKVINEKNIDVICLQEAAQHKDMPVVMKIGDINIRKHNIVLDIQQYLKEKYSLNYSFIWDWSHYGWDVWEEGVAILTRYNIEEWQSRYVSDSTSIYDIFARKVIKGKLALANSTVDVYSAHLNWWAKGFKSDIDTTFKWMAEEGASSNFILTGDLNNDAGSIGYTYLMRKTLNGEKIIDVYYEANSDDFRGATIRGGHRIDYIITNHRQNMTIEKSERVFTKDCERVSDHMGVLAELRL